jgi:tetratricopeptide (TPR) repeat protein
MSEREKLRTHGVYAAQITGNYEQAISIYSELVTKYPSDSAGHNNLAVAYFNTRNFQKALEEGARVIGVYPKSVLYRYNYALYAMYAGDFATADRQARAALALNPNAPKAYLAIAMADIASGKNADARQAYAKTAALGPRGASLSALGLADLDMYEGKYRDAASRLEQAMTADVAAGAGGAAAIKQVALAEAQLNLGQTATAAATAEAAVTQAPTPNIAVPAASILIAARREADAKRIADDLGQHVTRADRAAARIVAAMISLAQNRAADAVAGLQDAAALDDLWLVRFYLGAAYAQKGEAGLALAELEQCERRVGEMTAVFLDDIPTFRYRVPLLYWLGKTRLALGQATAHATLIEFLGHRPPDATDAMTVDARHIVDVR